MCPSCPFASIWSVASDGAPYNILLDLNNGDIIQHLASEYIWSEHGKFMALGFAQKIEVIRSDLFENYLQAETEEKKNPISFIALLS